MLEGVYRFFSSIGYTEPLHPAFTHMPIGLVVGALIFGLVALLFRRASFWRCAWNCLLVAEIFLVVTVVLGLMDWQHFLAGAWLFPIKVKVTLAVVLFCLIFVGLLIGRQKSSRPAGFVAVLVLSFLTVGVLGYFGGRLVYAAKPTAAQQFEAGAKLFGRNCQSCHPGGGNVVKPEIPLRTSGRLTDFKLFFAWIRNPEPPMPAFSPLKISDEQAHQLYDYIVNVLAKQPSPG